MLRALVVLLLLANLLFWAWSEGALEGIGMAPARERHPERLALQVHPDAVRVLSRDAADAALKTASDAAAKTAGNGALSCLEAGPFSAGAIETAEQALTAAGWPAGSWVRIAHEAAAQVTIVIGPFGNREARQKKEDELGRLRIPVEAVDLPGDGPGATPQPGFALGRYANRAAAETALAALNQRGVRTARVTLLKPPVVERRLRVDIATAAQASQLRAISGAALGAGFAPCAPSPAAR